MPLHEIDRQLIDRCLKHEPGAWNDFVERYIGLIYHITHHVAHARSLMLSAVDVEDVAAEVFLAIVDDDYGVLRRFKGGSSLPTYLTVVIRRVCVREIMKRQRREDVDQGAPRPEAQAPSETEPYVAAEEVGRMLEDLPEREAEAIRLYHLKHFNYREIGERLEIPENSVGPILAKARQRLRQSAEQRSAT